LNSNVLELLNMALASGASVPMTVSAITKNVATATQIKAEREAAYLQKSPEKDQTESVAWDIPYGNSVASAWLM
jgi:hypothetical protein